LKFFGKNMIEKKYSNVSIAERATLKEHAAHLQERPELGHPGDTSIFVANADQLMPRRQLMEVSIPSRPLPPYITTILHPRKPPEGKVVEQPQIARLPGYAL
jgi:hypothetical protein